MKEFLTKIGLGFLKMLAAFVVLAIAARFLGPVNWFFFQKNEHDRVFYTLLETEKAIAAGQHCDVLMFGSSTCENAIDPQLFSERTGLSIFKFVTGAQTIDMSVVIARYLVPKFQPKFVVIDAYPRYGGELTEEGVERAVINSPNAGSELVREILSVDPSSPTTDFLWLARLIGTSVKPYDASAIVQKPWEFEMIAPGYTRTVNDPPATAKPFFEEPLVKEAITAMNDLHRELATMDIQFVAIVPPMQNARIRLESEPEFPVLLPLPRPDTCFFDGRHMRRVCIPAYTMEVAERFNTYRSQLPAPPGK